MAQVTFNIAWPCDMQEDVPDPDSVFLSVPQKDRTYFRLPDEKGRQLCSLSLPGVPHSQREKLT